jgi:putative tryptophan/tyrosine transport system substrate-binding protein
VLLGTVPCLEWGRVHFIVGDGYNVVRPDKCWRFVFSLPRELRTPHGRPYRQEVKHEVNLPLLCPGSAPAPNRRRFLGTLAGGLVAAPLAALAQQAGTMPRVGFLEAGSRSVNQHFADAFRQGLRELGYTDGQNIRIEERWAEGMPERFPDLVAALLKLKVDVIIAASDLGAVAAKKATTTLPVVFVGVADPVGMGLVESLARPGGNATGLSNAFEEGFAGKWVELLREAVTRASRVAVLFDRASAAKERSLRDMETAATALGVRLREIGVREASEFDAAFATIARDGADGLVVWPSPLTLRYRARIVELAATHHLPAMYGFGEFARAGGLMAYGPSVREMFHRASIYVDRILKGAKPADLPVEQPTKFELVINLKTAKALGLAIPQAVLARADEVVQ